MYQGPVVTLEQVLECRESRAYKQREWVKAHSLPLVSFTINMMGAIKKNQISAIAFSAGVDAICASLAQNEIKICYQERCDADTGYEFLAAVEEPDIFKVKRIMVDIEEDHPLGRLFDIDIIPVDLTPISRQQAGHAPRRCLLCQSEAKVCARSRVHSQSELIQHMMELVYDYQSSD